VTHADFEVIAQALEPRIKRVIVSYESALVDRHVQPVYRGRVTVSRRDFGDPDSEIRRLRDTIERRLQQRVLLGHVVQVEMEVLP
jgi:hypothetical protein